MADTLRTVVMGRINRLKKDIARGRSELASLKAELARYDEAHRVLAGRKAGASARKQIAQVAVATHPRRMRPQKGPAWEAVVLEKLPDSFTTADVVRTGKTKSKGYARQVVTKWARQRRVKRLARGKYRKA